LKADSKPEPTPAIDADSFAGSGWTYTVDPSLPVGQVVISEFLAENATGLKDEDGDPEDWVELFNSGLGLFFGAHFDKTKAT